MVGWWCLVYLAPAVGPPLVVDWLVGWLMVGGVFVYLAPAAAPRRAELESGQRRGLLVHVAGLGGVWPVGESGESFFFGNVVVVVVGAWNSTCRV